MSAHEIDLILLEAELAPEDYSFDSEPEFDYQCDDYNIDSFLES